MWRAIAESIHVIDLIALPVGSILLIAAASVVVAAMAAAWPTDSATMGACVHDLARRRSACAGGPGDGRLGASQISEPNVGRCMANASPTL